MTVTELAHFYTRSGDLSPALRNLLVQAIEAQDEWCSSHLPATSYMANGLEARGVALYQQVENPAVVLLTAHWDSVAQHMEWIQSQENQRFYPLIQEHLDMSKFMFFHVDQVAVFVPEVLEMPVIAVARYSSPNDRKEEVASSAEQPKGGWRIEKDDTMIQKKLDEFVLVTGAGSIEATDNSPDTGTGMSFEIASVECEVKHYTRIL